MNEITFTGVAAWIVGILFSILFLFVAGLITIEMLWRTLAIKSKKGLLKKWDKRNEMTNKRFNITDNSSAVYSPLKVAVILFAYKRPKILKKVLATHYKIDADYFCFIDHSEMQDKICDLVNSKNLYTIIKREKNELSGGIKLNSNITTGITEIFKKGYDVCIILEDDILIKEGSLEWLKEQLSIYRQAERIGAISLCKGRVTDDLQIWGWAVYKDVWQSVDWSLDVNGKYRKMWNKTHSWDVYLAFWFELNGLCCRCHHKGLSKHIGYTGTHFNWLSQLKSMIK